MSEQRVRFRVRNEALSGLREWFADRIDASCLNQLCGNTAQADKRYTGLQAVTAPDAAHIYRDDPTAASDDQIRSNFRFTLTYIDAAVERAQTLAPAIRPIRVGEMDLYVAFLHTINVTDMRQNTATGQWLDIQKAAMTGGEIEDNPLFAGKPLGIYNGTLLLEDTRVPTGVSATGAVVPNVRRPVLCGAQAAMMAFGRENGPERYTWVEELSDY